MTMVLKILLIYRGSKLTTTVYTICWNEIFLLPHFFEHYAWADKIIVYDNGSDDGSQEFVEAHPKGELRFYHSGHKQDNQTMRVVKNECWKGDTSDWVIVCDMDEFLMNHEKLENYPGEVCVFNCKQWEMVSTEVPADFKTITLRARPKYWACKGICFSPKIQEINYSLGAHWCFPAPDNVIKDVLELNHYSALSEDYLVKRWQRYASRIGKKDLRRKLTTNYLWEEQRIRDYHKRLLCLAQRSS